MFAETMLDSRVKPWEGLGMNVEDAPTSKDAIKLAGLDWKVESRPIYDINGNVINGYKANTRDKDDSVLGIVTDKYQIVQNEEAFEFTDSLLGEGVTYETAGSLRKGRTIWLLAKMPTTKVLDDDVEPYICFANTHDGTGAIKVCLTPVRVICQNTLNFALRTAKRSWATKHMGNIQTKLEEARHTLQLSRDYMAKLDEDADRLANTKLSDAELEAIFDSMFPIDYENDTQRKINNVLTLKENFFGCLNMADVSKYRGTAFAGLMAATDMVAHCQPQRLTANYRENNWGKIMNGHPFVDALYERIAVNK